jgi:hypothetical protein
MEHAWRALRRASAEPQGSGKKGGSLLGTWKKTKPRAAMAVLVVMIAGLLVGVAAPATATLPDAGNYTGYGTGTNVFLGLLNDSTGDEEGGGIVANVGSATASTASRGLVNRIRNEMNVQVQPPLPNKKSFAEGIALELDTGGDEGAGDCGEGAGGGENGGEEGDLLGDLLGGDNGDDGGLLEIDAVACAPPDDFEEDELLELDLDPLAYAQVLYAKARANWADDDACILGKDISQGLGNAADAQLLDLGDDNGDEENGGEGDDEDLLNNLLEGLLGGDRAAASQDGDEEGLDEPLLATSARNPIERAAAQARSRMVLVPQQDEDGKIIGDNFGLMAEVRQNVAPVTLFKGDEDNEVTIDLLGEWVLRVVAGGIPGSAFVHFGPAEASPSTPVVRIGDGEGGDDDTVLDLEDIVGEEGLDLDLSPIVQATIVGLRSIRGESETDPQIAADGTSASAAIDVVCLALLGNGCAGDEDEEGPLDLLEVIVGHFEAAVRVPPGGINCPLKVDKVGIPDQINAGEKFTTDINVINPYDCDLIDLRVEDVITTTGGARFRVDSISDGGQFMGDERRGTINWSLGTLKAKQSRKITATFIGFGGRGTIIDKATARGTCALGSAVGETTVNVGLRGEGGAVVTIGRGRLPVTGGPGWLFVTTALVMSAVGAVVGRKALRMLFGGARI